MRQRQDKRKEKKRMQELLKSEDIEMVQLGITLMKHLLKRDKWEETLLLAFAIVEKGRFAGQKWEWQITEENDISVTDHSQGTWTTLGNWGNTYTYTTLPPGTVTSGTSSPCTATTNLTIGSGTFITTGTNCITLTDTP